MRKFTRRALLTAVPLAITGTMAFAFITAQGDGTGHAAQGTEAPTLQVGVAVPSVDFGKSGTVELYVKNASTKVSYKPTAASLGDPAVKPIGDKQCPAGSFVVSDFAATLPDHALVPGESAKVGTATLSFVDLPAKEQTGCLGADVTIAGHVQ